MKEQMAEEARHLHNFQASYQRLVDDSTESEVVTKNAEQVITTARAATAKAKALIQVNEQKLAATRERLEELEATKKILLPILPSWSLFKRSWLQRDSYQRKSCRFKLWRKPKRHASRRRCSAFGNGSILWRSMIISLLLLFVFFSFFHNTPFVK